DADIAYVGGALQLMFRTSTIVGAFPLISPATGRADYGAVIAPRFDWTGVGQVLAHTGWKTLPSIASLPMLPHSESGVPAWVISSIVLFRLQALLREAHRRFRTVDCDTSSPRGEIRWAEYAQNRIPNARLTDVPCSFPELQTDQTLLGAVHYVLRIHHASLQSQRASGVAVVALLDLCQALLDVVQRVPPRRPTAPDFARWTRGSLVNGVAVDAIAGMEWTIHERGLAGLGDLSGLPWMLPMELFFESWVETVAADVARIIGGTVAAGRERKTVIPIRWQPSFVGSQRYLLPDVVLTKPDHTIIFDAKYKQHWDELDASRWSDVAADIRDTHRSDLLQVLAYSTVAPAGRVTCCLVYPCRLSTWERLISQGRVWHHASIGGGGAREVELVLCAIPMGAAPRTIAEQLCRGLR
ncbi:MAG TPA: hypothetical protein VJQ83_08625, partial [Tepidiformaceae bacterium]|nr:hypothetical protein [Tepidiformaceae bacterium]